LVWAALAVVGLIFVGWLVLSLLGTLLKLALFLFVGAAVVGGAVYLVGRAKRSVRGGNFKQLP
jgi:hypothetical protein